MSKDTIKVNMNVYDIPIVVEQLKKLEQENKQLKENYERIYNENCKLRENHNINDISLLDENKQLKEQLEDTTTELFRANKKISEAIEYINDIPALIWNEAHEFDYDFEKLLEILGDKNE